MNAVNNSWNYDCQTNCDPNTAVCSISTAGLSGSNIETNSAFPWVVTTQKTNDAATSSCCQVFFDTPRNMYSIYMSIAATASFITGLKKAKNQNRYEKVLPLLFSGTIIAGVHFLSGYFRPSVCSLYCSLPTNPKQR